MRISKTGLRLRIIKYYSICAPIQEGTQELMNAVWNKLQTCRRSRNTRLRKSARMLIKNDEGFTITEPEEGYFIVEAAWFPRVLRGVDIEDYESLQYMQRVLEKSGVYDALRERGIKEGDTVSIYDIEFEYVP